ncbi:hypothetical protein [Paenibacillus dauci]|uniref:hypothetical protein n=1 Tax=Paenibacillus dauci TaxID=1567106 RepID=UPI0006198EF4|nr:hypothetical protein [Paenibacillus dauci]
MNQNKELLELSKALLLEQENDIDDVNRILNEMCNQASNEVIEGLCALFDDDIEETSLISDMVETIFYIVRRNNIRNGVQTILESTVYYGPHSSYCFEELYHVLLNSEDLKSILSKELPQVDYLIQQKVKMIINQLAKHQPALFAEVARDILKEK